MKKIVVIGFIVLGLITTPFLTHTFSFKDNIKLCVDAGYSPPKGSREELYQDIFVTLLDSYIDKAITEHYGGHLAYDPWSVKILNIERPNGGRTGWFKIKLEVMPYILAHNTVGTDHIVLDVSAGGKVKIEKFEHIEDHTLPPHLKNWKFVDP